MFRRFEKFERQSIELGRGDEVGYADIFEEWTKKSGKMITRRE